MDRRYIRRRFKDFVQLDYNVRSAYVNVKGHLLSSFPPLPAKASKLVTDHKSAAFLEKRSSGLDTYLKRLCTIPYMQRNPDFLGFLGWPRCGSSSGSSSGSTSECGGGNDGGKGGGHGGGGGGGGSGDSSGERVGEGSDGESKDGDDGGVAEARGRVESGATYNKD